MTFDYGRLRGTADRLIARFGQAATLVKPGALNEATYPVTRLPDQRIACTVVVDSYTAAERNGTLIAETDVKLMIKADVAPSTNDVLEVAGGRYHIMEAREVSPGGVVLMYEARGRAG